MASALNKLFSGIFAWDRLIYKFFWLISVLLLGITLSVKWFQLCQGPIFYVQRLFSLLFHAQNAIFHALVSVFYGDCITYTCDLCVHSCSVKVIAWDLGLF